MGKRKKKLCYSLLTETEQVSQEQKLHRYFNRGGSGASPSRPVTAPGSESAAKMRRTRATRSIIQRAQSP